MKKIYILAGCAFLFSTVSAQNRNGTTEAQYKPTSEMTVYPEPGQHNFNQSISSRAFRDTIWYEDFASGFPAGWSAVDNTGNNYEWVYDTQAPGGQFSGSISAIQSITASNGFMSLASDNYNSPYDPNTNVAMDSYFQTDAIDCSSISSVILKFQQYFRYCCSTANNQLSVFVSPDGSTWTEFDVRGGRDANTASPNVDDKYINISAVAANEPTVYLRFHQIGASHYFWMVDDIAIMEGPENDIWLENEFVDFNYLDGGFYTQMPGSQLSELTFRGAIFNNGWAAQTDVAISVDIDSSGTSVYNETSTINSFPSLSRDTLEILLPSFTPSFCPAMYDVFLGISQNEVDQDSIRNSKTVSFEVSDTVYARDYGTPHASIGPHNYVGGDEDGSEMGALYEILEDDQVTSVSLFITNTSDIGNIITAKLYWADETATTWADYTASFSVLDNTQPYTITDADTGGWLTLEFLAPIPVSAGDYIASIEIEGLTAGDELRMGRDLQVNQPKNAAVTFLKTVGGASPGWYTAANQVMIRLGVEGADTAGCANGNINIEDFVPELSGPVSFNVYPNPNHGEFSLAMQNRKSGTYIISVNNIIGQQVYTERIAIPEGSMQKTMDLSDLEKGVYFFSITDENSKAKTVRKIVLY